MYQHRWYVLIFWYIMMYSPAINVYAASIRRKKHMVGWYHHQKKKLLDSLIGWSSGVPCNLGGTNVWYVWSMATELIHWHVGTRHNDIHSQQQRFCWTLSRFYLLQYIYLYIYIFICWVPNVTLLTHWGLRALGSRSPTFHLGKACSKVWVVKLWSNGCGDYRNNFSAKASRPTITS